MMVNAPNRRIIVIILAFAGMILPIAGFHKFYLGQPRWGILYLLLSWTPIPNIASAIEAVWYLTQDGNSNINILPTSQNIPQKAIFTTEAIRQLDQLRLDGLISEYEFEQKRRQLLENL